MNWSLNSIRIYVSNEAGGGKQIMPILQPLAGGSVVQFYGYETTTKQISGLVVGATNKNALLVLKETATAYTLTSPEGSLGSFYVKDVKYKREPIVYQTIDTTQTCETPVYSVDIDLQPS